MRPVSFGAACRATIGSTLLVGTDFENCQWIDGRITYRTVMQQDFER